MAKVVFVLLLGTLLFLYNFWSRLKEDYISTLIFNVAFLIVFGALVFGIVSIKYFTDWWFWLVLIGATTGLLIGIWRFNLRLFETFEAAAVAILALLVFVFLSTQLLGKGGMVLSLVSGIYYVLFFILDRHYKRFTWYRSGRVGFSGMAVLGMYFLTRSVVAIFFNDMVSFVGNEPLLSGAVSFISFMMLYNLSRIKS